MHQFNATGQNDFGHVDSGGEAAIRTEQGGYQVVPADTCGCWWLGEGEPELPLRLPRVYHAILAICVQRTPS